MQTITIVRGLELAHRADAARLYDEAFGRKLRAALPHETTRRAILEASMRATRCVAAHDGQRLLGLAGYALGESRFTDGLGLRGLIDRLGYRAGLRAAALLALLARPDEPGVFTLDGLAVDASSRGRGIGQRLLHETFALAREAGARVVRLDVIDGNDGARRLYERLGFQAVAHTSLPWLEPVLGFGGSTRMHLPLK